MHPKSQSGKTKSPITTKIRTYVDPLPSNAIPDISEKPERPPPKTKNERFYARHNYVPLDDEEAELDIKFPDNKCYMCHQCEKQTRFKKKASLRYTYLCPVGQFAEKRAFLRPVGQFFRALTSSKTN